MKPIENGWYWVRIRAFRSSTYTWAEEWLVVEFDQWWRWDWEGLGRKGLRDMTKVLCFNGPIEQPKGESE